MAVSEVGPQRGWSNLDNLDIDQFVHFLKRFALPDHSSTVHYHARDYPSRCSTGIIREFQGQRGSCVGCFSHEKVGKCRRSMDQYMLRFSWSWSCHIIAAKVCFYHTMHQEAQKIRKFAEAKKPPVGSGPWFQAILLHQTDYSRQWALRCFDCGSKLLLYLMPDMTTGWRDEWSSIFDKPSRISYLHRASRCTIISQRSRIWFLCYFWAGNSVKVLAHQGPQHPVSLWGRGSSEMKT